MGSMDPFRKTNSRTAHLLPTAAASRHRKHPDPPAVSAASSKRMSLNSLHRALSLSKPENPEPPPQQRMDMRSQAKAMSLSASSTDSSGALLANSIRRHTTIVAAEKKRETKAEKEKEKTASFKKESKGREGDIEKQLTSLSVSAGGGRRRSLGGSKIELPDFLTLNGVKVVAVDMPPYMQIHAVDCARKTRDSLEKFTSKALALTLKKAFDGQYGPAWHCIVGTSFGSFVTHSVGGFMYFSMDQKLYVLLFKTTVQRAE